MSIDRAIEHRALATQVWRQLFELFVKTKGQREHIMQRLHLSPNDAKTLALLDSAEAKPMRALAEACCTDASNATWVVDRLERLGLVERRAVPGDRRVKLVALTTRGAKTRGAIMQAMHEPPLEVLALDRNDLVALGKILAKIPLVAGMGELPLVDTAAVPKRRRRTARLATQRR